MLKDKIGKRNPQNSNMMDFGYESSQSRNCVFRM